MVAARDEPGRIEIELTSGRPDAAAAETEPLVARPLVARPLESPKSTREGRRLLGTAATVGVLGLLVGVVLGRAGSDESKTGAPASSSTAPANTSSAGGEPIATLTPSSIALITRLTTTSIAAPIDVPSDSRATVPTAPGQSSEQVVGSLPVDPSVGALPIEVVGLTVRGDLVQLDLATGRTTTQSLVDAPSGPPVVLAGDGWIARPSWDFQERWLIVRDDGVVSRSAMGDVMGGLIHPTDGLFWVFERSGPDGIVTEIDLDGAPTGRAFEVPGFPENVDPASGDIVVVAPGGSYVVGEDGSTRVTSGHLIALGVERVFALECDDTLECEHVVIERATGDRRPITLDGALGDHVFIRAVGAWMTSPPLNRAEDAVLVIIQDQFGNGSSGGVLDLEGDQLIEITEQGDAGKMRWTPDGESVLWLDRGRLRAFDLETRSSTDVAEGLALLTAFTIRSALPSVEAVASSTTPSTSEPSG